MELDVQLEWTEWFDNVTHGRDGLRILEFWMKTEGVEVWTSKGTVEFFFLSDQI